MPPPAWGRVPFALLSHRREGRLQDIDVWVLLGILADADVMTDEQLAETGGHVIGAWPSMARLGRQLNVSRRTVQRAIARLETAGILQVERQRGKTNQYGIKVRATSDTGDARSSELETPVTQGGVTGDTGPVTPVTPDREENQDQERAREPDDGMAALVQRVADESAAARADRPVGEPPRRLGAWTPGQSITDGIPKQVFADLDNIRQRREAVEGDTHEHPDDG